MQTSRSALLSRPAAAPCFVVSPHLDDAVFSCGMFLASRPGAVVCTVFCGAPEPPMQTPWDASAGHRDSSEAMRARIAEDERALAIVGAHGVRLPFLDSQYGATPAVEEVARALGDAWRRSGAAMLVAPLGLHHSDHILVSDACRLLCRREGLAQALVYEDAIYRTRRGAARFRCEALAEEGWRFEPFEAFEPFRSFDRSDASANEGRTPHYAAAANAKWRAVRAYRSQLRAFADPHPHDLSEPERYRRLIPGRAARRSRSIRQ
jgi:LmbE family N-acetylglucosaminyl deacetylase